MFGGNKASASVVRASSVGVKGAPGCCFAVKDDKAERARWMARAFGDVSTSPARQECHEREQ